MKRIVCIAVFLLITCSLFSRTFYISSTKGNDNNNGLTPDTPWASISKAIGIAEDGDVIALNGGDEF